MVFIYFSAYARWETMWQVIYVDRSAKDSILSLARAIEKYIYFSGGSETEAARRAIRTSLRISASPISTTHYSVKCQAK